MALPDGGSARGAAAFPGLTTRELEVLDLLAAATPTADIADRLGLTNKTVSNHVSNILTKLQVADRNQAAIKAREAGLGRAEEQHSDGTLGGSGQARRVRDHTSTSRAA